MGASVAFSNGRAAPTPLLVKLHKLASGDFFQTHQPSIVFANAGGLPPAVFFFEPITRALRLQMGGGAKHP